MWLHWYATQFQLDSRPRPGVGSQISDLSNYELFLGLAKTRVTATHGGGGFEKIFFSPDWLNNVTSLEPVIRKKNNPKPVLQFLRSTFSPVHTSLNNRKHKSLIVAFFHYVHSQRSVLEDWIRPCHAPRAHSSRSLEIWNALIGYFLCFRFPPNDLKQHKTRAYQGHRQFFTRRKAPK